jgi:hypothetical protein
VPETWPYHEPNKSSSKVLSFIFKYFSVILHLRWGLLRDVFPSDLLPLFCKNFLSPHECHISNPSLYHLFEHPNEVYLKVKIWNSLCSSAEPLPYLTSRLHLGPTSLPDTLYITSNICWSLNI